MFRAEVLLRLRADEMVIPYRPYQNQEGYLVVEGATNSMLILYILSSI